MKARLFEVAILWHPNEKEEKDGKKTKILVQPKFILAIDQNAALMASAMEIPQEYKDTLDQIQVALRPF